AVVNREQGVKTPNGRHLRPQIKAQIADLHRQGKRPAQIAEQIPGLTARQVANAIQLMFGNKNESYAKLAQRLMDDPNATATDYHRMQRTKLAQRRTGNPEARPTDYESMQRAKRAKKLTGDPKATPADYQRVQNAKRARELTGDPEAAAADYHRIGKKARREGLTYEQVVEAEKRNPTV
ncbi:DUF433 domain-containing protein, partial [Pseudomonas asuensis]|uniref:DUF433 domain-containing protein n=1 Tax=Pseudomonas asuensis TaxID=1825787 RepID=UPI001E423607